MSQIFELFKLQMDNKYTLFKQKNFKSIAKQIFKYLVFAVAIMLVIFFVLQKIFFLLAINVNVEFMALVLVATQGISFVFAISSIINTLYLNKDNELFMVMPVTFNQLFMSKIMMLYIGELIFNTLYILPILLAFGMLGHFGLIYYIMLVLFLPVFPLLPIALASIVSIPIMFVVKFFKRHSWATIIFTLVSVAVLFVLYMRIVSKISSAINIAEKQIATGLKVNSNIMRWGSNIFLYTKLSSSFFEFNKIGWLFLYLGISLILMTVCFLIIRPFYYKVATISLENTSNPHIKPRRYKFRKPLAELLVNEFKITFRSPAYIFQFLLFPLFMPLIVYVYDKLLIGIAVNQAGQNMIFGSHILILTLIALMSNTISSIALSKEGANFYLIKVSPIGYNLQVTAKLLFNMIFTIGAILITTITSFLFTDLNAIVILLAGLMAIILSIGHICHSFDMDLQNPILQWYDNSEITLMSKSTTKSMIYALVLSLLMFVITTLGGKVGIIICIIISLIYLVSRIHLLRIRVYYYFNHLEV